MNFAAIFAQTSITVKGCERENRAQSDWIIVTKPLKLQTKSLLPSGILWFHFVCGHALPPFHFSFLQMRFSMCGRQLNSTKTVWNILFFFGRDIIFTSNRTTHHLRNKKIQNEFWFVRKSRNCILLYHHLMLVFYS